jgi:peptidoglycan glycosyltransferase
MSNRVIAQLSALFAILFTVLAARQFYVQVIAGPQIAARAYNPRHALLEAGRGRILATDGSALAETVNGKRVYPLGPALAQSVGYLSQRYGTSGIEDAYDRALTPPETTGDPFAQWQEIVSSFTGQTTLARGADVVTTIVPSIETDLYNRLAQHPRAAGVVLDPRSGAVLALASVPSYDPTQLDALFPQLIHDAQSPLIDRALDGLYPPGSTFKMFTASTALDSSTFTMDSTLEDPGYLVVGDYTLHDNEGESTGTQDFTGAFALSSNVDYAQIALKLGTDTFYQYLDRWGIGASLDFQVPAERARVPPKDSVQPGELAQMGFGQGALLMTPLQMSLLGATIAAAGNEPRPFIVRQIVREGAVSSVYTAATLQTPISADTAANVKKMMIAVVQRGTGTTAQLPGVTVAGKTGTATNPQGRAHSWFVAFAPAENPRIVVAIIVENGGYGADVAAPIAREVLRAALQSIRT